MLSGGGKNASAGRQGRGMAGMSTGALRSLGRNLKSDLKDGQEDLEDLLHTTLSGEKRSSGIEEQGNVRAPSSPFHREAEIDLEYLPQIPLGPHVNLSAFGAEGVSGSQYQAIKQVLNPIQILVSFFGGGDVMCGVFPSTCPPHLPRRKRSLRNDVDAMCVAFPSTCSLRLPRFKRSPRKNKYSRNGVSKKPSQSRRRIHAKNFPPVASAAEKVLSGGLNSARLVLGMVNGQQDRRMYYQHGRMPFRPRPSRPQSSPDYDY